MKTYALIVVLWGFVLTTFADSCQENPLEIKDGQFQVYDKTEKIYKPFFVRGMAYTPEQPGFAAPFKQQYNPIQGKDPNNWEYSHGSWLCYVLLMPWSKPANSGEASWNTPCFDSDSFGYMIPAPDKNYLKGTYDKYNEQLKKIWDRDLALMKLMGVNTIRLYNVNPKFHDHKQFFDLAYKYGIYIIPEMIYDDSAPYDASPTSEPFPLKYAVDNLMNEIGSNPALLYYNVGNELDDFGKEEKVKQVMMQIRGKCPKAKVGYASADLNNESGYSKFNSKPFYPELDIVGLNLYRGDTSKKSSRESYENALKLAHDYFVKNGKAVLITEVGVWDNQDNNFNRQWFNYFWRMLLDHYDDYNTQGAIFFTFYDEPITKKGTNDRFMGVVTPIWPSAQKPPAPYDKRAVIQAEKITNSTPAAKVISEAKKDLILKTSDYNGIPGYRYCDYCANPASNKGKGRFEMFVPANKSGIAACNYVSAPSPWDREKCEKEN